jgi:hypothetical protein
VRMDLFTFFGTSNLTLQIDLYTDKALLRSGCAMMHLILI